MALQPLRPLAAMSAASAPSPYAAGPPLQLSAKRKRSPTSPQDGTAAASDTAASPAAAMPATSSPTHGLLVPAHASAPRLRMLSASTPLLTMPAPSSELLPVLTARAARAAPMPGSEIVPFGSTGTPLLRSTSAAWAGLSPAAAGAAAAGAAATAASHAAQLRAAESAALDRERSLRVSVEELRAAARAKASDLAEAALRAEQRQAQFDLQKAEYEARIEKLQTQMRFIHGEEAKEQAKRKEREAELNAANLAQREQLAELHRLKKQLASSPSRRANTPAESSAAEAAEAAGETAHLEKLIKMQARTILELESHAESLNQRVDEADEERLESANVVARLEHTEAQLEAARSALRLGAAAQEAAEVTGKRAGEFLAAQTRAESLQAENSRLLEQKHNAALAAEQLRSVQAKCARLESERDASARIALENDQLKERLLQWEESMARLGLTEPPMASEEGDVEMTDVTSADAAPSAKRRRRLVTPQPFLDSYHQLQSTNLTLQERAHQAELQSRLSAKEQQASQERITELANSVARQELVLAHNAADILSLQRKCTLLTKEREGLQKVLDAYDNEQAPLVRHRNAVEASPMQVDNDPEAAEQHRALKARVQYLETIVKELESQLRSFARENGIAPAVNPTSPSEPIPSVLALLSQVTHLEKQQAHLGGIASDLTEKVEWVNQHYPQLLDTEHGALKIVHLPSNPSHQKVASKHQANLEAALKEVQILRLRCEELQQSAGEQSSSGDGPSASSLLALESAHASRVATLESEKSQLEKKTQRLKEIFGQKVLEFRNTCYLITGYKIEMIQGNSYRLKSMYSEREADHLLFQQKTDAAGVATAGLSVLETDFTKGLDGAVTNYLEKFESIPGFLAAVTLQLLEKQTKLR